LTYSAAVAAAAAVTAESAAWLNSEELISRSAVGWGWADLICCRASPSVAAVKAGTVDRRQRLKVT
jgi:hypothetical protein